MSERGTEHADFTMACHDKDHQKIADLYFQLDFKERALEVAQAEIRRLTIALDRYRGHFCSHMVSLKEVCEDCEKNQSDGGPVRS